MVREQGAMHSASIEVWDTEGGRWGASVTVRCEGRDEWHEKAVGLVSADDAVAWARARIHLARRNGPPR
jgi:hypothetical protein